MTENGAIEWIRYRIDTASKIAGKGADGKAFEDLEMAITALEEIQSYRAIGTVERFKQLSKQFAPHCTDETSCRERHCNKCDKYRKENEQYHAIGTVEECRTAVERMKPKKPYCISEIDDNDNAMVECPICHANSDYAINRIKSGHCWRCGQALDWSE